MPSTVNGIGTHYYGKKNQSVRNAACRSCNRVGNLESYDTRLWFVVVFIPIIPLGRKRILDACPSCTRHYVVKADVYEQTKQLQTSASLDRFRREQSTESALEAHGQLLGFHEHQQAADFRQTALAKFPDHAGLRAGLAAQLKDMSSYQESRQLFHDSFDLDPELPEARVGVAEWRIAEGNYDEARQLLDFLMEPGVGQRYSLGPLDYLATNLQNAGRHEEVLEIAEVMLRELPKLGDSYAFRKFVKKSEKALGQPDSILPERGFSVGGLLRSEGSHYPPWIRKLVIGSIAALLIMLGLAVNNEYIKGHRTLHVLNATGQTAQVQVDDQPAVVVSGLGRLTVPEGSHVIKVTGPVTETQTITLGSEYFDRWINRPAWVMNLGGEAVLEDITHVYSAHGIPSQHRLLVGQTFFSRPHIDYIFTAAPNQMQVKNKTQEITKTEIAWVQGDDNNAFLETIDADHKGAMSFAEKRLRRNSNQPELLKSYVGHAIETERGQVEEFLKAGINQKPVNILWHRAYQSIAEVNKHGEELLTIYDKLLANEPTNAAFLYLRGRIEPNLDKQEKLFQQAIEADPKLGWPWLALASRADSEARWNDCREAALKAQGLNINEPERISELLHDSAMGLGEAKSLVEPYRTAANGNMQNASGILFLIDALAAAGREGEIEPAIKTWLMRLPVEVQGQVGAQLRALSLYYAGKLAECADFYRANPVVKSAPSRFHSLVSLGRLDEASDEATFGRLWTDPTTLVALSVGFGLDGKTEDAARWRGKALGLFAKLGDADIARAAMVLAATEPPAVEELRPFQIPPDAKAVLLASLAVQFPAQRELYLAEASKFNVRRKPPYQLIKKAIEGKPAGQP